MNPRAILIVDGLRAELDSGDVVVDDLSLEVAAGQVLGLVGESGSGKTTTALALLGYARAGVRIVGGEITLNGEQVLASGGNIRGHRLRGRYISYIPQDPATSLNPSLRIRDLVGDMVRIHVPGADHRARTREALARMELPSDDAFVGRFPHQLSGGQKQRVAIAGAVAPGPLVVVFDEPTTGLDVITQARILNEIQTLRTESNVAAVYVSHDLAVVASIADRVAVMYAGQIVEEGPTSAILSTPRHPYTHGLVASIPDPLVPRRLSGIPGMALGVGDRPPGCVFAARCGQRSGERALTEVPPVEDLGGGRRVRCFEWQRTPSLKPARRTVRRTVAATRPLLEVDRLEARHGEVVVVDKVSFALARGESVALVGASGSGKTTLARCIAGLHVPVGGRILFAGEALAPHARARTRSARRQIQIIFQDPTDSLNPRTRIVDTVARPARVLRERSREQARTEARELLERVRLPAVLGDRFPRELSGGERQRVAIARALAGGPSLLVCDEITSALDVSVQAAVLELLEDLRVDLGLSLLFITHDLGVVASVADRVLVLDEGVVCEQGDVERVLSSPERPYTRRLVEAAPRLMPAS